MSASPPISFLGPYSLICRQTTFGSSPISLLKFSAGLHSIAAMELMGTRQWSPNISGAT